MEQFSSLLHLDGYGAYVWPAYGVAALVLIGLLWWTVHRLRGDERLLASLQTRRTPDSGTPSPAGPRPEAAR